MNSFYTTYSTQFEQKSLKIGTGIRSDTTTFYQTVVVSDDDKKLCVADKCRLSFSRIESFPLRFRKHMKKVELKYVIKF